MDHGLSTMDPPPQLPPDPHKTTVIERKLQYHVRQDQHKKPFDADAVIVKIQGHRCSPNDADNNRTGDGYFMPVDHPHFAEPV